MVFCVRRDRLGRAVLFQAGKGPHDRGVSGGDGVPADVVLQEIGDQIVRRADPFVRAAGVGSGEQFAEGDHAVPDPHGQGLAVRVPGWQRGHQDLQRHPRAHRRGGEHPGHLLHRGLRSRGGGR